MNNRLFLPFGVAMALLAGCDTVPQSSGTMLPAAAAPAQQIALSPAQVATIQDGVRNSLKDPASAIFSGPTVAAQNAVTGDITACGMVNAKNSYGGYVGASPYIATVSVGKPVDSATASGQDGSIIVGMCKSKGVAI